MNFFSVIKLPFILTIIFCNITFAQECFIKNQGQFPAKVIAKKKINGGALFIENSKLTFSFYDQQQLKSFHNRTSNDDKIDFHAYSLSFLKSNYVKTTEFLNETEFVENYYLGDKSTWVSNVNHYEKIVQKNIYEGIDLILYEHKNNLKYDLYLHKNSNYKNIKIKYSGQSNMILRDGNLIISTSVNSITELKPYAYQIIEQDTVEVECNYILKNSYLSFDLPNSFDKSFDLVIDPTLIFSTYSGSISDNFGYTATYDNLGFLYSGSTAFGVDYPTTIGAFQMSFQGGITDIAITKYDTLGTSRIYSTYLGGSADELPHSMVVNANNELFILGTTGSDDFPITSNAFQNAFNGGNSFFPTGLGVSFPNGSDIFITKINKYGGALLSSTFLGGTDNDGLNTSQELKYNYADEIRGEIDIDNNNNVFIVSSTYSNDFPTTNNVFCQNFNGGQDGCIIKMDDQLSNVLWSSFLGGSNNDAIYSLEIDKKNNIYVTGGTVSTDFPTTPQSYNSSYNGSVYPEAFVCKIQSDGLSLINSTFFGSIYYDQSYFIELNNSNDVYVFGQTRADSLSLVLNSNYYVTNGGQFISVFDSELTNLKRSTVFGTGNGSPDISPTAFLVDKCNSVYISGWGSNLSGSLSTLNLPVTTSAFQNTTDGNDFYLAVFDELLDSLEYATYFGGSQSTEHVDGGTSRFDKNGIIYQSVCAGCGGNNDFPIYPNPGAVSSTNNSPNCNNAVFKFDFKRPIIVSDFSAPTVNCTTLVQFTNSSSFNNLGPINYFWDFGDGTTSSQVNPQHQYQNSGSYDVSLIASSSQACNFSDTIIKTIYVLNGARDTLEDVYKCRYDLSQIGFSSINDSLINFNWSPNTSLTSNAISNPFTSTDTTTTFQLIVSGNQCNDTLYQKVIVNVLAVTLSNDTSYCSEPILFIPSVNSLYNSVLWSTDKNFSDTLSQQITYAASIPQTYHIKISDSSCIATDSIKLKSDLIDIELISDTISCSLDTLDFFVQNNTLQNPLVKYLWSSENIISYGLDSSSVKIILANSEWHSVEVENSVGCIIHDSIFVNVYPSASIDSIWANSYSIPQGSNVELFVETTDSVLWFNASTEKNIELSPTYSLWYKVKAYNEFCEALDSIFISVREVLCNVDSVIIPTGFTPNADGINDSYKLKYNDVDIEKFHISIFNRLGQEVFYSKNIDFNWNGKYRDIDLLPQVLNYYIEITCVGGNTLFKKGNITLIR